MADPRYLTLCTGTEVVDGRNVATSRQFVPVVIEPDLPTLGITRFGAHWPQIALRKWDEQVLLHEALHVLLAQSGLAPTEADPWFHNVIRPIEVGLTLAGWRLTEVPQ